MDFFALQNQSHTHTHTQIPDTISSMLFSEVFSPHWVFLLPAAFFFFFYSLLQRARKENGRRENKSRNGDGENRRGKHDGGAFSLLIKLNTSHSLTSSLQLLSTPQKLQAVKTTHPQPTDPGPPGPIQSPPHPELTSNLNL